MEPEKIVTKFDLKDGREVVIRYPQSSDVEIMQQFINTASSEHTFIRMQGEQTSIEEEEKYLNGQLEKIQNHQTVHLLAFCDGELAGSSDIHMHDRTEKHLGTFGIIIGKDYRSQGLGKKLMKVVISEAKTNLPGLEIIILEVYGQNQVAQKLYKSLGFIEYGSLPKGVLGFHGYDKGILMHKPV